MNGRLLIAGTNSGCGKTTVVTAVLAAMKKQGYKVSAFKCGPDYIDPMFHRAVLGVPSCNLDPFFSSPDQLRRNVRTYGSDINIIEGVMGYYDGIGTEGRASTYRVARAVKSPVVLVMNVRGMYTSVGAVVKGFAEFKANSNIKGVIFNGASPMLYSNLAKIAEDAGVKAYGFLPRLKEAEIGSRHLGLITAGEIKDLQEKIDVLAENAIKYIDIRGLLTLAHSAPRIYFNENISIEPVKGKRPLLAFARDEAFCFIYRENIDILKEAGFDIAYFSPLHDEALPKGISALYLPGGYPELYAEQLSANNRMLDSVKSAVDKGLPTYAECGGFLYLLKSLDGIPMAGAIEATAAKTPKLQHFGYVTLTAKEDNLFCKAGESIRAHEFHYYDSDDNGSGFKAVKPTGKRGWECVHISDRMYAGFPHLYLQAAPQFAVNFAKKAAEYGSL